MLNVEEIRKELGDIVSKCDDHIDYSMTIAVERLAIKIFGRLPYMNQLTDRIYDKIDPTNVEGYAEDDMFDIYDDYCTEEEYREKTQNIDMVKTTENIIKAYPDALVFYYRAANIDKKIIFHDTFIKYNNVFYMDTPEIPEKLYDCVVEKEKKPQIRWVLKGSRGSIETKYMDITAKGDIENNYNDDFIPINKKINDIIRQDDSCVMILHGKPGTGKTTYIRRLIADNPDVKFYWLDSSMFEYIDTSDFIEYIATCKNGVFILEDSESLLKPREDHNNPAMQGLLNISDGILGDSLKLKFICTFNTDLKNIDKAILRKGRMKVKYEFKDLEKEKVEKLFEELNIDKSLAKAMPLCDIYNFLDDNGNNTESKNKLGFNV